MTDRPNVLVIYADQMRYDCMGCSGNPDIRTPYLDRMADEGVMFDNAFVSYPLCTPFRASFLTGKYAHATGVFSNHFPIDPDRQPTLAPLLNDAGYQTGYIGKWHLFGGPKPGFVPPGPHRLGFQHFVGYNRGHAYMNAVYYRDTDQPFRCRRYEPDFQTDHAIEHMASVLEAGNGPFFTYVCYGPPHYPMNMPGYLKRMYDPEKITLPRGTPDPAAQRTFVDEQVAYDHEGDFSLMEKSKFPGKRPGEIETEDEIRQFTAEYYAMITNIDHNVGILLNWLEGRGVLEDTIVVFLSDHGDMLGSHGRFCGWKRCAYRAASQVPFLVRHPTRFGASRRMQSIVDIAVDTMPTLLDILGLEGPEGMQGTSYLPVLESDTPVRDAVTYQLMKQSGGTRGQRHPKPERGIRTRDWLYVRKKDKAVILVDQSNDPLEQDNLVDDPAHAEVQRALDGRVKDHMAETGDDWDLEMPWPPPDFVSHKDADKLLEEDILPRAIPVP